MEINTEIRTFIARNYLPDEPAESITDTMSLITSGIIDSIGMLGLIDFIESHYGIEFLPREIDIYSLDTVGRIESLIRAKLAVREASVSQG